MRSSHAETLTAALAYMFPQTLSPTAHGSSVPYAAGTFCELVHIRCVTFYLDIVARGRAHAG